jgi:hypothetical protein
LVEAQEAVPDIYTYEIVEALAQPGCPLCRAVAIDDRRLVDSFRREGRQDRRARTAFFTAGGFCQRHAWLLHRLAAAEEAGAAIADLYGWLADEDLRSLERVKKTLARRGGNRKRSGLERRARCPACRARDAASERKVHFFVQALDQPRVRERYRRSDGVCYSHLSAAVGQALANDDRPTAEFLLEDWSPRLAAVRAGLAEYDRKRDYRFADEPKGEEQRSWTEVIRRYVGDDFTAEEPA